MLTNVVVDMSNYSWYVPGSRVQGSQLLRPCTALLMLHSMCSLAALPEMTLLPFSVMSMVTYDRLSLDSQAPPGPVSVVESWECGCFCCLLFSVFCFPFSIFLFFLGIVTVGDSMRIYPIKYCH